MTERAKITLDIEVEHVMGPDQEPERIADNLKVALEGMYMWVGPSDYIVRSDEEVRAEKDGNR